MVESRKERRWWEHHSPDCSTKYRGCAPECPKARFERLLCQNDTIPASVEPFKVALLHSQGLTEHLRSKINELKRQIETLEVRLLEKLMLQENILQHLKSLEG